MSNETIARRYSSALADVVAGTPEVETVKTELAAWDQLFASSAELTDVFGIPEISHAYK